MAPAGGLVIVKIGGSLQAGTNLPAWLSAVAQATVPCVVVPGGGPFADSVRRLQGGVGFDDLAAHRMAILAMQQYGLYLQTLEPRLALAETEEALARGAVVWLPWRLAGLCADIEAGWDVTSDSLALWLAPRLAASRLLLVKAAALPAAQATAAALAADGVLDPAFPVLLRKQSTVVHAAGPDGARHLPAYLAGRTHSFTLVASEVRS